MASISTEIKKEKSQTIISTGSLGFLFSQIFIFCLGLDIRVAKTVELHKTTMDLI